MTTTTTDPFVGRHIGLIAGTARRATYDDGRHTITMTRHFQTSIDDLWDACINPERLRGWIGELSGDRKLGGTVRLAMSPSDDDTATISIKECRDPERLRLVWSLPKEADTEVRLTLRPVSSTETLLTLEHAGLEHGGAIDYGVGWEDFLIRLDTVMHGDEAESVQWDDVKEAATPVWTAVVENRAGTR